MLVPFRRQLGEIFRSDRPVGNKMIGGGFVMTFVAALYILKLDLHNHQQGLPEIPWTSSLYFSTLGASALLGCLLGLALSLRDGVKHRIGRGDRVHPLLRLSLGSGGVSLGFWIATIFVVTFLVAMVTL